MSDNLDLFGSDAGEQINNYPAGETKPKQGKCGQTLAAIKEKLTQEIKAQEAVNQDEIDAPNYAELDIPVPNEHRPRYVVRNKWTKTYGRAGVWYHGLKAGREDVIQVDTFVCTPLHVLAVTRDGTGRNFGRLLRLRDTLGDEKEWAMPMNLVATDGAELRAMLLDMGAELDPDAKAQLLRYIQSEHPKRQVLAATKLGWHDGGYLMPDKFFAPAGHEIEAVLQDGVMHNSGLFEKSGVLATWTASVSTLAVGNPLLVFTLSTAFAGPLLKESRVSNGGFHISGETSTGKSTVSNAAASVWGNPEKGKQSKSWRSTANGLEGAAAMANDGLLVLDELGELSDPKELGNVIYFLGNGSGKSRAGKSGSLRPPSMFRLLFLSNGELDKRAMIEAAKGRVQAGMDVRMIELTASRRYGAFDDLRGFDSGGALSNAINQSCAKCYGVAGPAFLQNLLNDTGRNIEERHREITNSFEAEAGAQGRVAALFALVALGGELATEYGLTGWQEGTAIHAAKTLFNEWRKHRPSGNQEAPAMLEAVQSFIDTHGGSRFENRREHNGPIIRDRAGWYEDTAEGRVYHFTKSGIKEAFDGFDLKRGLDVLEAAGWLLERDKQHPYSGKQQWMGSGNSGANYRVFSIFPRDSKKSPLELLELLEPITAGLSEPNKNLTEVVRAVRKCNEMENLTTLTKHNSILLEENDFVNQCSNSPNNSNSEKTRLDDENTFLNEGRPDDLIGIEV